MYRTVHEYHVPVPGVHVRVRLYLYTVYYTCTRARVMCKCKCNAKCNVSDIDKRSTKEIYLLYYHIFAVPKQCTSQNLKSFVPRDGQQLLKNQKLKGGSRSKSSPYGKETPVESQGTVVLCNFDRTIQETVIQFFVRRLIH